MGDPLPILHYRIKIFLIMPCCLNEPRLKLLLHDLIMINLFLNYIVKVRHIILLFCRLCISVCTIRFLFTSLGLSSFRLSYHCFEIIISICFLVNLFKQLLILLLLSKDDVVKVATRCLSVSSLNEFSSVVKSSH